MLRQARWDPADKSQVLTEVTAKECPVLVREDSPSYGVAHGARRADYVLLGERGRPLPVVEAKKLAIHPYTAKQQVLPYAKRVKAPF